MLIKVKKLNENAKLPAIGSKAAAGADLYACLDHDILSIACHSTVKVPTGIAIEIPEGYFGAIFARSGLATKKGLRPGNCVGVVDSDYRGEIMVALHNDMDTNQMIENNERIAQFIIMPCISVEYSEADELSQTERGDGGFGSTGTTTMKKKKRDDPLADYGEW